MFLPHTAGRYAVKRFRKAQVIYLDKCFSASVFMSSCLQQCPIVERLTNALMKHGRNNGKKMLALRIVRQAFEIIHLLTGEVSVCVCVYVHVCVCTRARVCVHREHLTLSSDLHRSFSAQHVMCQNQTLSWCT